VAVPPLRERKEDLNAIIDHTLDDLAQEGFARKLSKLDRQELHAYDWPGNVRQLIQVLRRAVYLEVPIKDVLAEERQLGTLAAEAKSDFLPDSQGKIRPIKEIQREYAQRALDLLSGNYRKTARALGISVNTLRSWLEQE
jgi:DNA-binding NtrC family response regulator